MDGKECRRTIKRQKSGLCPKTNQDKRKGKRNDHTKVQRVTNRKKRVRETKNKNNKKNIYKSDHKKVYINITHALDAHSSAIISKRFSWRSAESGKTKSTKPSLDLTKHSE